MAAEVVVEVEAGSVLPAALSLHLEMKLILLFLLMLGSLSAKMTEVQAAQFVKLALAGLDKEFPNKPGHIFRSAEDVQSPKLATPVFYGHFDWHSSVHGHWTLVRLLRLFPSAPWGAEVRSALDKKFVPELMREEAAYLKKNPSFERMYGWAWALRLGIEVRSLSDQKWAEAFQPVEEVIVANAKSYLPKLTWPIRCGFHPESAFALGQMLDWARATKDADFEALLLKKARGFYLQDKDYPVAYEPSGNDFFSAGLNEADLMRRVLANDEFSVWLDGFFPDLAEGKLGNLLTPAQVSDLSDGHLVHLAGLNLTRAWTMRGVAGGLAGARKDVLLKAAQAHEDLGLSQIFSGSYAGEHWLGSFATYLLTEVGQVPAKK